MKATHLLRQSLTTAAALLMYAGTTSASMYHVSIDTSALNFPINAGSRPFSLDFQLNSGNTLNNNTASLSHFNFGGGGLPFGAANVSGGASGDLSSTITLRDTGVFNEFFQSFTAGTSIGFDLSLTQNVDAGLTPDAFAVAILDKDLFNIPTSGLGDTLLFASIDTTKPLTIAQLNLARGTGNYVGVSVSAIAIPEPATFALITVGLAGLGFSRRKRV